MDGGDCTGLFKLQTLLLFISGEPTDEMTLIRCPLVAAPLCREIPREAPESSTAGKVWRKYRQKLVGG